MILLVGRGQLAAAIEQRLQQCHQSVTRLKAQGDDEDSLSAQTCSAGRVLILATDDDAGNIDLALKAKQLNPDLRLVVRLFDNDLATYLSATIPGITILSVSSVSAPVVAEAARLILKSCSPQTGPSEMLHPTRNRHAIDRVLLGALISFFLLVFPSAAFFASALDLSYMDALYFVWTTVMTVGYGDISLKEAGMGVKLFGMLLMLGGAAFIAILFAIMSDWVLMRRLDVISGRIKVRGRGHVLIVGAGNIGFRVAETLADEGHRLVIIEKNDSSKNGAELRRQGHHTIIADATNQDTQTLAGLDRAALVVAVTDADAINLQIALKARAANIPVIVRMVSPELAAHVHRRGDGVAFSLIVEAAHAFAAAATQLSDPLDS